MYNPVKVREYKGYDKTGKEIPLELAKTEESFGIQRKPDSRNDNCEFSITAIGFRKFFGMEERFFGGCQGAFSLSPSIEVPQIPLMIGRKFFTKPVGMKMEVVPLRKSFFFETGDNLQVQVFFDGKPLPNAKVEYEAHSDTAPSVQSDAEGKARVPVSAKNEQFIAVDYQLPADNVSYSASLRYELK